MPCCSNTLYCFNHGHVQERHKHIGEAMGWYCVGIMAAQRCLLTTAIHDLRIASGIHGGLAERGAG